MASLKDLLKIKGVVAAGEFTASGGWVNYESKIDLSPEMITITAQFAATITMMHHTLANAFSQISDMKWVPQKQWTFTGGDWAAVVSLNRCVFVEAAKADYNKLYEALVGPR
jgi:roadblock/LC7 domain-containing protein